MCRLSASIDYTFTITTSFRPSKRRYAQHYWIRRIQFKYFAWSWSFLLAPAGAGKRQNKYTSDEWTWTLARNQWSSLVFVFKNKINCCFFGLFLYLHSILSNLYILGFTLNLVYLLETINGHKSFTYLSLLEKSGFLNLSKNNKQQHFWPLKNTEAVFISKCGQPLIFKWFSQEV